MIISGLLILTKKHFETMNNSGYSFLLETTQVHFGGQYPFHELNLDDCLSKIHIPKKR
jgi:hypothetical protein